MRFSLNCLLSLFLYATSSSSLVHRVEAVCTGVTNTTRLFDENIKPDFTAGTGVANGAFTVVRTSNIEIGLRAKTRYPTPKNPTDEAAGQGQISPAAGRYAFPAGTYNDDGTLRQLWAFDWSVNTDITDLDQSPTFVPKDYTYELGVDDDPTADTSFDRYDPISHFPFNNEFDFNNGMGDSGFTCDTSLFDYAACLRINNVVQNTGQYSFIQNIPGFLKSFNPNFDGNYVIYFRVLAKDPTCGKKYVVAETYIEVLIGDTAAPLATKPVLPKPL
jgi:hypothetical protein